LFKVTENVKINGGRSAKIVFVHIFAKKCSDLRKTKNRMDGAPFHILHSLHVSSTVTVTVT